MSPRRPAGAILATLAALLIHPAPVPLARGHQHKLLLPATGAVERMIGRGELRLVERYGSGPRERVLVSGTAEALSAAEAAAPGLAHRRIADRIHLAHRTVDTSSGRISPRAARLAPGQSGRLELIQFHGPVKSGWLERLRQSGKARPVTYLPQNAYLVWVEDPEALTAARLPLQWREEWSHADRLSPELASSAEPVAVTLQVVRGGDHDALIEEIQQRALAVLMAPVSRAGITNVRVTLPPGAAEEFARRPEVAWVEPFPRAVTHDERAALICAGQVSRSRPAPPGYVSWLETHGLLDLGGMIVDVTDTGIDTGGTSVSHPALAGRIAYALDLTGEGDVQDCAGHGTNIAGIIGGAPSPGSPAADPEGYLLGLGVAPGVRLGATRIFDCAGAFSPTVSFTAMVSGAYARGARIGNNSWGGPGSQYNTIDAEYDALVRDVDLDPSNGDQGFLPVFSSGNLGPQMRTVGWPATAKNALAVGATENYRPTGTDGCGAGAILADNVDHVLNISGRGPTGDGRFKPDLVAPGSHVQSLASGAVGYTGVGVCDSWYPAGQRLVNWSTGTSQAAAHVTGVAAIAAELYRRENGSAPSPAMLKAMLINHAHDMGSTSQVPSNTSHRPNFLQGWGRVDLGHVVAERARVAIDQTHLLTASGDVAVFDPIVTEDANQPVIVTLVWTDAPGAPSGWSLVNDLDLLIEAEGQSYRGNVLDQGVSVPGGSPDALNNVEIAVLPAGTRTLSVTVEAANIAGDGIPSRPGETDQDFALYVSNARFARPEAVVALASPAANCGSPLSVRLADQALRGVSRSAVEVSTGGDRETVPLDEVAMGAGVFSGAIDVVAGQPQPGDGVLQTVDGLTVTASYHDPDPATGIPVVRTASVPAACAPPVITAPEVTLIGDNQATVRWTTDRPADSVVIYGPGSDRTLIRSDARLVREHAVQLSGLPSCTFFTATLSSTDATGARSTAPPVPLRFSTGPGVKGRRILFRDDMEALGSRWTHEALGQGADDWELGFPSIGPPGPFSGARVWGTNLDGEYGETADSALVTPPIDLGDAIGAQLTFFHHYAITGGRSPASENDGAWVEVTADGGASWTPLDPVGGYVDTIDPDNPYLPDRSGVWAGAVAGWVKATFDLSPFSGSLIQLRFRLWRDPAEINPRGSGWYLDDVEVTAHGSCHRGAIRLGADEYGCSSRAQILLSDGDLNASPTALDSVTVTAGTAAGQMQVVLTETGASSGEFLATLPLSPIAIPGALSVTQGSVLTVTYADEDAGGGQPGVASASAVISDCAPPPPPSGITAVSDGANRITVSWTPVDTAIAPDLQGYRIHYDSDASGPAYGGTGALQGASPVRAEAGLNTLSLNPMTACLPHFIAVTAFDRLGNESAFGPEGRVVPNGSQPCAAARLTLGPESPGCRQSLLVSVLDANADPDPNVTGTVPVTAVSPAQGTPLAFVLTETTPASRVFSGQIPLSPVTASGTLLVSEDDEVTVEYADADDGRGASRILRETRTVTDCTPPVITGIRVTGRAADRATIRWNTDEPATSRVEYGFDPTLGLIVNDPALVTAHAVTITGLQACTPIHFAIASTDQRSNATAAAGPGVPHVFGTYREKPELEDDLEGGAPGWEHRSLSPTEPDEWELGAPSGTVPGGPPSAFSGATLWATDLDGPYQDGADMILVTPPLDLSTAESAKVTFMHWYQIHAAGAPNGFDDGAFLEVSDDGGATWKHIEPVGGYPDRISGVPYIPFGSGAWSGSTAGWRPAMVLLDAWVGKVVRVRFHLLEDPQEISLETSAGWYIDDLRLTVAVACHDGEVELDRAQYPCNGGAARVRVSDVDLDADPLSADTATVVIASEAEPAGETVALPETGPSTGVFESFVPISPTDAPGVLAVRENDTIAATYRDADDGSGAPHEARTEASVLDCTPPGIGGVSVQLPEPGSFRVVWSTTEPADSEVLYGTSPALGQSARVTGLRTDHDVVVTGLQSCTRYDFTVASTDAGGNRAREDTQAGTRVLQTPREIALLSESFDGVAAGWTHTGQEDTWRVGAPADSPGVATTAPPGGPVRPAGLDSDFVLVTPPINLTDVARPALVIRHAWDFATSFQGGDGGWVEAWDGFRWVTLFPSGGYPGFIDPEAGATGERIPGYSGQSSVPGEARFDLGGIAGQVAAGGGITRIRFHVFIEAGAGAVGSGWTIEEASVIADVACRRGRLAFGTAAAPCGSAVAELTLADRDLDVTATPDTVVVTAASTGGPAPLEIVMTETGPATGVFAAGVPLSPGGDPGTLRAAAGDRITASYADGDDGAGSPAVAVAALAAGSCAGPRIERVTLASSGGDTLVASWKTDAPATSEVTLSGPGVPQLVGQDHRFVTSHRLAIPGAAPCAPYVATVSSENAAGIRSVVAGPAGGLVLESAARQILFADDMEGSDPGWVVSGLRPEWQRGVPLIGPPAAFSGQSVYATDLGGMYDGGTDATLTSPPIDLTGVTSARLTFWHWYDVFADNTPNSVDDAVWVEVHPAGVLNPVYVAPIGGYPDTADGEQGAPLQEGTPVYAGQSFDWEKATFDLTPFAGKVVTIRFRIWNDFVELLLNGRTGAGWYLDDVEVSSPRWCHPGPTLGSAPLGALPQGGAATALAVTGTGLREGAAVSLGQGVAVTSVTVVTPTQLRLDLAVDPGAAPGPRDLVLVNPDGQSATIVSALQVLFDPARADLDGSGRIDGNDLLALSTIFGLVEGDPGYDARVDLNADGAIDGLDLALLATGFGTAFK